MADEPLPESFTPLLSQVLARAQSGQGLAAPAPVAASVPPVAAPATVPAAAPAAARWWPRRRPGRRLRPDAALPADGPAPVASSDLVRR